MAIILPHQFQSLGLLSFHVIFGSMAVLSWASVRNRNIMGVRCKSLPPFTWEASVLGFMTLSRARTRSTFWESGTCSHSSRWRLLGFDRVLASIWPKGTLNHINLQRLRLDTDLFGFVGPYSLFFWVKMFRKPGANSTKKWPRTVLLVTIQGAANSPISSPKCLLMSCRW
jgi:hypothetical protein